MSKIINKIKYRKLTNEERKSCNWRYKYELTETFVRKDIDLGKFDIKISNYIFYDASANTLWIYAGYWWDGPSFLAIDTEDFMASSCVHDAGYQLMREKKLSRRYRKYLDKLLVQMSKEDGMPYWRRFYVYRFVRALGWVNLRPEKTRQSSPL